MKNIRNSKTYDKLNDIFKKRFDIDLLDEKFNCNVDEYLIGKKYNFKARDLIYLLYDIEKSFNITVSEKDLNDIKFNTISNIILLIEKKLFINKEVV